MRNVRGKKVVAALVLLVAAAGATPFVIMACAFSRVSLTTFVAVLSATVGVGIVPGVRLFWLLTAGAGPTQPH